MRIIIGILFIFFFYSTLISQAGNPFEIKSRMDALYKTNNVEESSKKNIFDIERADNHNIEIVDQPVLPNIDNELELDTLPNEEESDIIPIVGEVDSDEETNSFSNPFDVSHIPIRRSKLKEEGNALKSTKNIETEVTSSNTFIFWLLLFSSLLLSIVINTQKKAIQKIVKSITNENRLKLNFREDKKGLNGHYLFMYAVFFINASIFTYLAIGHFYNLTGWLVFKYCAMCVVFIYLAKHIMIWILNITFPFQKEISLYGFTIESYNIFLGIILIPINLIVAFSHYNIATSVLFLGIGIIGVLLILRSIRSLLLASVHIQNSLFHFLLYLCAFEILPMLLFFKVIGKMNFL
ncbi:MAG: DUF4271 domain-containing protein [Saprospiraceae bacterium]